MKKKIITFSVLISSLFRCLSVPLTKSMTAAVLNERTFLVPEVSNCIYSGADISIKVETVENGIEVRNSVKPETKEPETSMLKHHKEELDPKLLQVAQLFVQDLLVRAKIEAHKKLASSENQVIFLRDNDQADI